MGVSADRIWSRRVAALTSGVLAIAMTVLAPRAAIPPAIALSGAVVDSVPGESGSVPGSAVGGAASLDPIEPADPADGLDVMDAPSTSSDGAARLSYPIDVPPGRLGMQPALALAYDSTAADGWVGQGWDLPISSIAVDTRFGVPVYDADRESESYTLDGQELSPNARRQTLLPRDAERVFTRRVEGSFDRIIRHGGSPGTYWWEVVDHQGVRSFYGGLPDHGVDPKATLADPAGHLYRWGLREVVDPYGNAVTYTWERRIDTASIGVSGQQIYPRSIRYTDNTNAPNIDNRAGRYTIIFSRDHNIRPDISIDARSGAFTMTGDRLTDIAVEFDGDAVRTYHLAYRTGAFGKTLLSSVSESDTDGAVIARHTFQYYDDARDAAGDYGFDHPTTWDTRADSVTAGLIPQPVSMLGGSVTSRANVHAYVGFNPAAPTKQLSFGASLNGGGGETQDVLSLLDLNGDGLADKVFTRSDGVWWRPNLRRTPQGATIFGDAAKVPGLPAIGTENHESFGFGAELHVVADASTTRTLTWNQGTAYFRDINGDGLPDLVTPDRVLYDTVGTDGKPTFSGDSSRTDVPVSDASIDREALTPDYTDQRKEIEANTPPIDTLRRWIAPYDGRVRISGGVTLSTADNPPDGADGVRVAVQRNDTELWSDEIGPHDSGVHLPTGVDDLAVRAGDRLYFRVQSLRSGTGDQVQWSPQIDYVGSGSGTDVNGNQIYSFSASSDFALTGRPGTTIQVPFDGRVRLVGDLAKTAATSDNLQVQVLRNGTVESDRIISWNTVGEIPFDHSLDVRSGDSVELRIRVDSGVDASVVRWTPQLYYTSAPGQQVVDDQGNPVIQLHPSYSLDVYPVSNLVRPERPVSLGVPAGDAVTARTVVTVPPHSNGSLTVTFKRPGRLLAKARVPVIDGRALPATASVPTKFGTNVYIDYSTRDRALMGSVNPHVTVAGHDIPAVLHGPEAPGLFAPSFRGWSYAGYNGADERATRPVDEGRLTVPKQSTKDYDPRAASSYPFSAFPADASWRGPSGCPQDQSGAQCGSDGAWVREASMSSTRLGGVIVPETEGSGRGLARLSFADQNTGAAGLVGFDGSATLPPDAPSWGQTDYIDLNGDSFPDIVGDGHAQYTTAVGDLTPARTFGSSYVRGTLNNASNVGFGGNPAAFAPDSRGNVNESTHGAAGGGDTGSQLAEFGVGVSINIGEGDSRTVEDLIDVNGDGLPDRVTANADGSLMVALSLGYSFAAPVPWGQATLDRSTSDVVSLGGGFNDGIYGYGGGVSGSSTSTMTSETLLDINGDGLPDRVSVSDGHLHVGLNTGTGFAADHTWTGYRPDDIASSTDTSGSLGGYFTIPVGPLCIAACYIIINPGGDAGQSVSTVSDALRDVDGNGAPDVVSSADDTAMTVSPDRVGRTNLLRSIGRPLGGRIDIDYDRAGNTPSDPTPRWVMSRVVVDDGQPGDGVDRVTTTYDYQGGVYDRANRVFLGFGSVRVSLLARPGIVARTTAVHYDTSSVETRGLPLDTTLQDADGHPWVRVSQRYDVRQVAPGSRFPALVQTETSWFEGTPEPVKTTSTDFSYDAMGAVTRTVDHGDAGTDDDLITDTSYADCPDSGVHLPDGALTTDSTGHVLSRTNSDVDCASGSTTEIRQYPGGGAAPAVTTDAYDPVTGNLVTEAGPRDLHGNRYTVTYGYDPDLATHVASTTDNFGLTTTTKYDNRFGVPVKTTDANGATTIWTYDTAGRQTSIRNAADPAGPPTVTFEYHPDAATPWAATHRRDEERSPGATLDSVVLADGNDRTIQVKQLATVTYSDLSAHDEFVVSGHVDYDSAGHPISQYYPTTEPTGTPGALNDGTGTADPLRTSYDVMDRPTSVTLPDGTRASMSYDVRPDRNGVPRLASTVVDAEHHSETDFTDTRGHTVAIARWHTDESGTTSPVWTSYGYDASGRQTTLTDAGGNTTTTSYDGLDRTLSMTTPDGGTTHLIYDPSSDLISRATPTLSDSGQSITYDYDRGRLTAVHYPQHPANDVTYTYGDANGPATSAGRLVSVADATGSRTIGYDVLGNQTHVSETLTGLRGGPRTYTTNWSYDDSGRLRTLTYPDGAKVSYTYDAGGRPIRVTGHVRGVSYDYARRIGYDPFGQRVLLQDGNGVTTTTAYDPATRRLTRLTSRSTQFTAGTSTDPFQDLHVGYDDVGNITSVQNDIPIPPPSQLGGPSDQTFQYDDLGRLTHASGTYQTEPNKTDRYSQSMRYDALDNITHKQQTEDLIQPSGTAVPQKPTTYSVDYRYDSNAPHAATAIGDQRLTYDAAGNQTGWTTTQNGTRRTIGWDEENRIASVSDNGRTTRYTYDDAGNQVVRTGAGGQLVAVNPYFSVRNGSRQQEDIFVDGVRLASRISEDADGSTSFAKDVYFYHPDVLGNVSTVTDHNGTVVQHLEYFPGGESWVDEGAAIKPTPVGYGGHELDTETGLYHAGARSYDPRSGQFLSPDATLAGGSSEPRALAAYSWADDNPSTYTDPTGRSAESDSAVAEPGFWESLIPVWGSGKQAVHDFQTGHYIRGTFYTALAISDVFLVKSLVVGVGKAILGRGGLKLVGGASWRSVQKWYVEKYGVEAGTPIHHWLVHQKYYESLANPALRNVARRIFNQPWNLMPMDWFSHLAIHNYATATDILWHGTPIWFKAALGSAAGRLLGSGVTGVETPTDSTPASGNFEKSSEPPRTDGGADTAPGDSSDSSDEFTVEPFNADGTSQGIESSPVDESEAIVVGRQAPMQ